MDALFSRTELVQAEALRRHKAAQLPGQLDLVDALNDVPPTAFAEIQVDDIVTFGSRKSEWVVTANDGYKLDVRCIQHPKPVMVGATQYLLDGDTKGVWLVEPRETPATITAYLATDGHGGSNVYVMGWTCRDCDRTFDPHYRRGVPCVNANWHAKHTVSSWRINGVAGARVVTVEIPDTGDRDQMAAAARQALADREAATSWPDPFGVFYDRQELNGQLVIA